MKRYSQFAILSISLLFGLILTGFQCGSTEMTSAKLYKSRGDWPNAEKSFEKEVQKNPANAEAWYELGIARYQLTKYEEMLAAFDQCLKIGNTYKSDIEIAKKNAWAQLFNAGVAYQNKLAATTSPDSQKTLVAAAESTYQRALKMNPDSASTYQNLAALYHNAGNTEQEIGTWEKARQHKNDPQFTTYIIDALIKCSQDARAKGDKASADKYDERAITEISEARKQNPNDDELLNNMINLYIEVGRSKEAMPYMREAIAKNPSNKIFQFDLGLLLYQNDSLDEAIQHYDAALAVDGSYDQALQNGALAYMKLGQSIKDAAGDKADAKSKKEYTEKFKMAVDYLERLTRIKPNDPNVWDALATAYGQVGKFKEAQSALAKADDLRKK